MWSIPFWTLLSITLVIAIIIIYFRGFQFIDFQVLVMVWALGFALDMLICKWLKLFFWVIKEHRGFYSFWACLLYYPSVAIIFLKLRPKSKNWISIYILIWSLLLTLFELFIIKPLQIAHYPVWRIIPWSPIGYLIVLTWIHIYYKIIEKRLKY